MRGTYFERRKVTQSTYPFCIPDDSEKNVPSNYRIPLLTQQWKTFRESTQRNWTVCYKSCNQMQVEQLTCLINHRYVKATHGWNLLTAVSRC